MSDQKIVSLAETFMHAAMRDLGHVAEKLQEAIDKNQISQDDLMKVTSDFYEITQGALQLENLSASLGAYDTLDPEYQELCLKTVDKLAGVTLNISVFNDLARHMPEAAKTPSVRQAYINKGAHNLANLAR